MRQGFNRVVSVHRRFAVIALAALACSLACTAVATAAEYTVNSTGDQVDEHPGTGCKTAVNTCTLRAAIEESNASVGVNDTIKFASNFNGQIGDTIELNTPLPTITDRVRIEGFPTPQQCETDYFGLPGPCVGVNGPAGGTAFRVEAAGVILIGFAISGAKTAIEAVGAPGLWMWNDWFGLKLDGSAGSVETGIFLDQGSNGASIGGASSVARDIFAHNTGVGLDIDGADATEVRGSGFGLLPDGNTPAPNGKDIEIADAATGENRVASGNLIGETLTDEQLASPICDGACNVISGATETGIDLAGDGPNEDPATGYTRIFGNYIGLNAFGTTGIPNALQGVLVGAEGDATLGGPRPGDRNLISGGSQGVLAMPGATNLTVEGNWVGLDPTGSKDFDPPSGSGVAVEESQQTLIRGNRISMATGTAIEVGGNGAVIQSNAVGEGVDGESLPGGSTGMRLYDAAYPSNLVTENVIANAGEYGILIENNGNRVYSNQIEGSGTAGIRIQEPPPMHWFAGRNEIGGYVAADENTISRSGGAAVQIAQLEKYGSTNRNEVARNNGALNGGLFIELLGGANEGILPPTISSSMQMGASGNAAPGATIRVFRKAGASAGEIEGFLAETVADGSGNWSISYPSSIPGGTMVAATQTIEEDGTSEFAFSTTAAESSGGDDDKGSSGSSTLPEATTPPDTMIFEHVLKRRPPVFAFSFQSSEPGSTFRCKLDKAPFTDCPSSERFGNLKPGRHVLEVAAVDAAGNQDPTPALAHFKFPKKRKHHLAQK